MMPIAVGAAVEGFARCAAAWSGFGIRAVAFDAGILSERATSFPAHGLGLESRNRSCRLLRTRDGWVALNLPRPEDRAAVGALLGVMSDDDPWPQLEAALPRFTTSEVRARARLLGLAAGVPGETARGEPALALPSAAHGDRPRRWPRTPRVIDLSALWAGPLCGALLAEAGCEVIRIESARRPDPMAATQPEFFARLNGAKSSLTLDLASAAARTCLARLLDEANVVITSARRRGLESLGLDPWQARLDGRVLLWIAISAHGLTGPGADRIGFGDDCAVAGGLVDYSQRSAPGFIGDAIADPLAGAYAATAALRALALGERGVLDVSLARTAAYVARTAAVES